MRAYKFSFLASFNISLARIVDYLLDISLNTTQRFRFDLQNQIDALNEFPFLYPIYQQRLSVPIRKMPMNDWKYVIFYFVDEKRHEIVFYDILHSSRDIPKHLQDKLKF